MNAIKCQEGRGKGKWQAVPRPPDRVSAFLWCPGCGAGGSLDDHIIEVGGMVQPSVACMNDCGFHEYVILEGWRGQ